MRASGGRNRASFDTPADSPLRQCRNPGILCDMEVESRIGPSLAALRRRAGLSRGQLAELAGTPVSTVAGIELGAIEPPTSLIARLTAVIASRLRGGCE